MQTESNRTKQRKSNGERKQLHSTNLDLSQIYSSKNFFELVKRKDGFETKLQELESPDSNKRAKSYTRTKIESGIAIRKIMDLIREKEKRRTD